MAETLCGYRPWTFSDTKAVSLTYLSRGTVGRRIFGFQKPTIQNDQIPTKDLSEIFDDVLTKQRTFDRYTFLTRKLLKGEPFKEFYGCLRELSLNCDLGSHEKSTIRDVFIANMQDGEIQNELLKETRSAKKALEVEINIEMGIQLKISTTADYNVLNQAANTSINDNQNSRNRPRPTSNTFVKLTICGYGWSACHNQNCPARGKN